MKDFLNRNIAVLSDMEALRVRAEYLFPTFSAVLHQLTEEAKIVKAFVLQKLSLSSPLQSDSQDNNNNAQVECNLNPTGPSVLWSQSHTLFTNLALHDACVQFAFTFAFHPNQMRDLIPVACHDDELKPPAAHLKGGHPEGKKEADTPLNLGYFRALAALSRRVGVRVSLSVGATAELTSPTPSQRCNGRSPLAKGVHERHHLRQGRPSVLLLDMMWVDGELASYDGVAIPVDNNTACFREHPKSWNTKAESWDTGKDDHTKMPSHPPPLHTILACSPSRLAQALLDMLSEEDAYDTSRCFRGHVEIHCYTSDIFYNIPVRRAPYVGRFSHLHKLSESASQDQTIGANIPSRSSLNPNRSNTTEDAFTLARLREEHRVWEVAYRTAVETLFSPFCEHYSFYMTRDREGCCQELVVRIDDKSNTGAAHGKPHGSTEKAVQTPLASHSPKQQPIAPVPKLTFSFYTNYCPPYPTVMKHSEGGRAKRSRDQLEGLRTAQSGGAPVLNAAYLPKHELLRCGTAVNTQGTSPAIARKDSKGNVVVDYSKRNDAGLSHHYSTMKLPKYDCMNIYGAYPPLSSSSSPQVVLVVNSLPDARNDKQTVREYVLQLAVRIWRAFYPSLNVVIPYNRVVNEETRTGRIHSDLEKNSTRGDEFFSNCCCFYKGSCLSHPKEMLKPRLEVTNTAKETVPMQCVKHDLSEAVLRITAVKGIAQGMLCVLFLEYTKKPKRRNWFSGLSPAPKAEGSMPIPLIVSAAKMCNQSKYAALPHKSLLHSGANHIFYTVDLSHPAYRVLQRSCEKPADGQTFLIPLVVLANVEAVERSMHSAFTQCRTHHGLTPLASDPSGGSDDFAVLYQHAIAQCLVEDISKNSDTNNIKNCASHIRRRAELRSEANDNAVPSRKRNESVPECLETTDVLHTKIGEGGPHDPSPGGASSHALRFRYVMDRIAGAGMESGTTAALLRGGRLRETETHETSQMPSRCPLPAIRLLLTAPRGRSYKEGSLPQLSTKFRNGNGAGAASISVPVIAPRRTPQLCVKNVTAVEPPNDVKEYQRGLRRVLHQVSLSPSLDIQSVCNESDYLNDSTRDVGEPNQSLKRVQVDKDDNTKELYTIDTNEPLHIGNPLWAIPRAFHPIPRVWMPDNAIQKPTPCTFRTRLNDSAKSEVSDFLSPVSDAAAARERQQRRWLEIVAGSDELQQLDSSVVMQQWDRKFIVIVLKDEGMTRCGERNSAPDYVDQDNGAMTMEMASRMATRKICGMDKKFQQILQNRFAQVYHLQKGPQVGPCAVAPNGLSHRAHGVSEGYDVSAMKKSAISGHSKQAWMLLDQHAIHERIRLEYFCAFAETFVCDTAATVMGPVDRSNNPKGFSLPLSTIAHKDVHNVPLPGQCTSQTVAEPLQQERFRKQLQEGCEQLLMDKSKKIGNAYYPKVKEAISTVVVPIQDNLVPLVAMCEHELQRWGWRFWYQTPSEITRNSKCHRHPTAVRHWPHLELEGFTLRLDSIEELRLMTEELLAVGLTAVDTHLDPSLSTHQTSVTEPPYIPPQRRIIPSSILRFFISRSCRGAIMFGDTLSPDAVRELVRDLSRVREYYICAHGRPSIVELLPL